MFKNLLITGGAGFIGSNIAKRCLELGYCVTIVDNLSTGSMENIPKGADFLNMDISNPDEYYKISSIHFDAVLHLAAQSSGEVSNENPVYDCKVNILSTLLLLDFCKKNNIERFIYASSMAIYGDVKDNPVNEEQECRPLSFYGISKLSSEHYISHYSHDGLLTTSFRMFSVYGPGQNMQNMKQGMVSIFMSYLRDNEEIWVKGSSDRFRDFVYIDDVTDAWIDALENPASYGKTFNLATGVRTTVGGLVEEEIKSFGYDQDSYPVKYEGSTPDDQFGLYADISKIKNELKWEPKTSLHIGIKKMADWIKG